MEYLSKERYDEILSELNRLMNVEYPKVKEDLDECRAQGDLSENYGYRQARRTQARMISRINFLQKVLKYARVIDTRSLPKDRVTLLSRVSFTNLATGSQMSYQIVSPHEMDLQSGKISLKSPIGHALLDHQVGDVVEADAPAGVLRLRIDSIDNPA